MRLWGAPRTRVSRQLELELVLVHGWRDAELKRRQLFVAHASANAREVNAVRAGPSTARHGGRDQPLAFIERRGAFSVPAELLAGRAPGSKTDQHRRGG